MAKKNDLTKKVEVDDRDRDKITNEIVSILNKESKDLGDVAFFLNDGDVTKISDWVSTGIDELDLKISNRKNGGLPASRIIEINAAEGAGKSLLAANLVVSTQKKGGIAVLFDTENAICTEFLKAVGVKFDGSFILFKKLHSVEDVFANIERMIMLLNEKNKDTLVTIIVDSLTAIMPKITLVADYEAEGYGTQKAKLLSIFLAKLNPLVERNKVCLVFTNQLREKIGVMGFGDKTTTSGGKALGYYASVRIRLKAIGKITDAKTKEVLGVKTEAIIYKNRMGPPHRKSTFMIYFESGTDNVENWITVLKDHGISTGAKKPHKYKTDAGEEIELTKQNVKKILREKGDLYNELYEKFSKALIKEYKEYDSDIEVVNIDNGDNDDCEVNLE